jgi:cytochrome P450
MAFILLFAGFETTVNLIGNGVHTLLRHPEQRAALQTSLARGESALLETAVEELLRYDGPVELATWRYATEPLAIGGQAVAAGDPVLVVLAAADRDPARFDRPDTLDLARRDNPHLGYGHGIHYCLGAPLARLEGRTALARLLTRLPDLRLAADPADLRWRGGLIMRGLRTLPVAFTPEAAGTSGAAKTPKTPETAPAPGASGPQGAHAGAPVQPPNHPS